MRPTMEMSQQTLTGYAIGYKVGKIIDLLSFLFCMLRIKAVIIPGAQYHLHLRA